MLKHKIKRFKMYENKVKLHAKQRERERGLLTTIALDVTTKCNMQCLHCYAEPFNNRPMLDFETLNKTLDEAYNLGVYHYVLQGGEPTADLERTIAIIKMLRADETYINVVSNGWAMDLSTIQLLKKLGVDKIAFSLDSGIREEHDANRVQGAYDKVINAIENVLAEGLLASISSVVTTTSLYSESFMKVYDFAVKKQIRLDTQIAMPVGKWEGEKDKLIKAKDSNYLLQLRKNSPVLSNGQTLLNRDVYTRDHKTRCPAGSTFMAITATGEILPCNFMQYSLGNIKNTSLKDARDFLLRMPWFQGTHPCCLLGEDDMFYEKYVRPNIGSTKPLNAYTLFEHGEKLDDKF